jgi:hypothetical protein
MHQPDSEQSFVDMDVITTMLKPVGHYVKEWQIAAAQSEIACNRIARTVAKMQLTINRMKDRTNSAESSRINTDQLTNNTDRKNDG